MYPLSKLNFGSGKHIYEYSYRKAQFSFYDSHFELFGSREIADIFAHLTVLITTDVGGNYEMLA